MSASDDQLLRGTVWRYRFAEDGDLKPAVIVSNDARNRSRFSWVHVVRITARVKRPLLTIVELQPQDRPLAGRVMCDDLEIVHKSDLHGQSGVLSAATMRSVDRALKVVLGLR